MSRHRPGSADLAHSPIESFGDPGLDDRLPGGSEAEIIREAIAARVGSARPVSGFLEGEPFAERVDELLVGFGESR